MFRAAVKGERGVNMSISESSRVGKRGTFVIPARLRRRFGLTEGSTVIAEETEEGILLRPAVTVPIESYTAERQAEFILSNALDEKDYTRARAIVEEMGIDPDSIPHERP
jgi:AbrB family looped-hinge helix DNA binding protein